MKKKIIYFIFLMAFLITAVYSCKKPDPDLIPLRPMSPTERIIGVFQTIRGDIISIDRTGFYMIGDGLLSSTMDYRAIHNGRYTINELDILELHRADGIMRLQIVRDQNREVISLTEPFSERLTFLNIVSERQYNNPISDTLAGEYRSVDNNHSYYLNLNSYRVSTFINPIFMGTDNRSIGGYYVDSDNSLLVNSDRGSIRFTIIRNLNGQVSSLRYREREIDIPLVRTDFRLYSPDELTMLNRNIIGIRFRATLSDGQAFDIAFNHPMTLEYAMEGEPITVYFLQQEIRDQVNNHGFNYNGPFLFRLVLRPGSLTEIDYFEAVSPDCPIRSLKRVYEHTNGHGHGHNNDHDEL